MEFLKYLFSRTITLILVVFIGMTIVFFVTRAMPNDPIESALSQMTGESGQIDAEALEEMRHILAQNYGLEGTMWEQYVSFLKRSVTFDFGPSFTFYPTSVNALIGRALPWTMGLMLTTTIIAWIIGNIIGLLAGFRPEKASSKILEGISTVLYPIPYYILALFLIMLFSYILPVFPLTTNVKGDPISLKWIGSVLYNSILPALSLILVGLGWWVLSMRTLVLDTKKEDYVEFAKLKGIKKKKIMWKYVAPNTMLPQVTALALQLGKIFSGSIIVEVLFAYPGIGTLLYNSVLQADYNLILGTITTSIIAVAVATYVVDMIYPLLDPRIRYS